ncbi:MAG: 4-hydroxybenzoate octaprenyltransferase [Candidatus Glassbacteria bacterium]|nr:4-hydroxybenzoate octaprenyltransferase [Candidatus Glassbacteria bacterium]
MAERTSGTRAGSPARLVRDLSSLVALPHTVFALPFALTAMVLASYRTRVGLLTLLLVMAASTGARSAAMAFNRLVDQRMDRLNPRTSGRHLPSGRLTRTRVWLFVAVSAAVFEVSAWLLGPLCFILSPVALAVVLLYSYTKYYTSASHWVLGLALSIAPAGAYLAVAGTLTAGACFLSLAVVFWVAGFDIIYSLQDESFDRGHGIFSVPARLGRKNALLVSRICHLLSPAALAAAGLFFPVGALYWSSCLVIALMLAYEHTLVRPDDLSRVNTAFFTVNGTVSILFFVMVLVDRLA